MDRLLTKTLKQATSSHHRSNAKKQHEQWFESLLSNEGFAKKTLEDVNMTTTDVRENVLLSDQNLFFIPEPLGSQNTPDFLVGDEDGNLFYVELKSSKKEQITWNGGYPKDNYIYLFSSGKHDAQTIFMGSDSWDTAARDQLLKHAAMLKSITDKFNKTLSGDQSFYVRNMFADKTKYYSRKGRKDYEQSVVEYIESFAPDPEILISFDWPHVVQPLIVLCRKFKISFKASVVTGVVIKIPKEDCLEEQEVA